MNKNILMILITILIVVGIAICITMSVGTKDVPSVDDGTALSVTGEGTITAEPDTASVSVGVNTMAAAAADAQAENSAAMEQIIGALKAMGIASEDIVTESYSIYPQYDYNGTINTVIGYQVSNSVSVTLHDIDMVGDVLAKATAAGANMAGSISFSSSKADELYNQALTEAYAAAKLKGEVLADAAGMKVKGLISLSEGADYSAVYAKNTTYYAAQEVSSVPIETGQLTFSATVTAVYSVK